MKQILVYYRLTLLNTISIILSALCGVIIVLKYFKLINISELFVFGFGMPIVFGLLFTILDVAFISKCRHEDDIDIGKYEHTYRRGRRNLTRTQKLIAKNINALALLVIFISIVMIIYMGTKSITEGIILYSLLLITSGCHFYCTNKNN